MIFYMALIFAILVAGWVLFLVCYGVFSVIQEYWCRRVPGLLYHQIISKEKIDKGELINEEPVYVCYDTAFAEQMAFLHREGYTTISLDEFLAFQQEEKPLPPKPILVTFDDGFMSNYLYAFPVLKKYGMKATIFVTPDQESENFKMFAAVDAPLTKEQIKEMSDYGISIESHAMTHCNLTELKPDAIRWELEESKRVLEKVTHKPIRFLAIPSGAYNRTIKKLAIQSGYQAVFGRMLKGSNNAYTNQYALRRNVIGKDFSIDDFLDSLQPATACQLRLTSFLQNLLLSVLGLRRFDAFRDGLYRTMFASFLHQGQLKSTLGGLAIVFLIGLLFSIFALSHYY
jgi:peptidoglycan/xylan/chitin deacetylase (PgdA/CDA1 family)